MSERDYQDFIGDVDKMAAYWVVRLSADDCSPEDRFAFDAWRREDPAHEEAYLKIRRGNDYLDRFMGEPDFQARIELARKRTKPPIWKRPDAGWMTAAAACLVIAAVGVLTISAPFGPSSSEQVIASAPVEAYETTVGERSTVTLADGSIVTINTNSRIEVDYTSTIREIKLTRGQGFFDVAKDINRPFVVVAGDKRVMALGTVFDVRFDDANEVQVTLVEGKVKVEDAVRPLPTSVTEPLITAAVSAPIEMKPGERLIAKVNEAPEVFATDTIEETSWRKGQMVFRQRALADVVAEMNRYSAQKLVLDADDRVLALNVSGVFNNGGPPAAFVDALEAMHPLEAKRSGADELTLVWRE